MATITTAISAEGRVRSMKCDYRDEKCVVAEEIKEQNR